MRKATTTARIMLRAPFLCSRGDGFRCVLRITTYYVFNRHWRRQSSKPRNSAARREITALRDFNPRYDRSNRLRCSPSLGTVYSALPQ
jgi:hypothetical protein